MCIHDKSKQEIQCRWDREALSLRRLAIARPEPKNISFMYSSESQLWKNNHPVQYLKQHPFFLYTFTVRVLQTNDMSYSIILDPDVQIPWFSFDFLSNKPLDIPAQHLQQPVSIPESEDDLTKFFLSGWSCTSIKEQCTTVSIKTISRCLGKHKYEDNA